MKMLWSFTLFLSSVEHKRKYLEECEEQTDSVSIDLHRKVLKVYCLFKSRTHWAPHHTQTSLYIYLINLLLIFNSFFKL